MAATQMNNVLIMAGTQINNVLIMAATHGARPEDVIPLGLFTVSGFINHLRDIKIYNNYDVNNNYDADNNYEYCILFMEIDKPSDINKADYISIWWNSRTKIATIDWAEQEVNLERLKVFLIDKMLLFAN